MQVEFVNPFIEAATEVLDSELGERVPQALGRPGPANTLDSTAAWRCRCSRPPGSSR